MSKRRHELEDSDSSDDEASPPAPGGAAGVDHSEFFSEEEIVAIARCNIQVNDDGQFSEERMEKAIKEALGLLDKVETGGNSHKKFCVKKKEKGLFLDLHFYKVHDGDDPDEKNPSEEAILLEVEVLRRSQKPVKNKLFKRKTTGGMVVFGPWWNYCLKRLLYLHSDANTHAGALEDYTAVKIMRSLFDFIVKDLNDVVKQGKLGSLKIFFGVDWTENVQHARKVINHCGPSHYLLDGELSAVEAHVENLKKNPLAAGPTAPSAAESESPAKKRQMRIQSLRAKILKRGSSSVAESGENSVATTMSIDNIIQLEDGWNTLKGAIDVLEKTLDDGFGTSFNLSSKDYVTIYTTCYDMCTQRSPYNWSRDLYMRHGKTIETYLRTTVLPAMEDKAGEGGTVLLNELKLRWSNHQIMNKWLKKFFIRLNRNYVEHHSLPTLEQAGLQHFKDEIYQNNKDNATSAIISLINEEREGEIIDKTLVKSIVELYESMGMGSLDAYTNDLEQPLLEATREYYVRKHEDWIAKDSTSDYLIKAEKAVTEEKARVLEYLNPATEPKILKEIVRIFHNHLWGKEEIDCSILLENDKTEDLQRIFQLFSWFDDGLQPMANTVEKFITSQGNACINNKKDKNDDHEFVKSLVDLHEKYLWVIKETFANHHLFRKALKNSFEEIVVQNNLWEKEGSGYCSVLLENDKVEDLQRMFQLISQLDDGLQPMANTVQKYITSRGNACIDSGKKDTNDDQEFVKSLIDLHGKYLGVVKETFANHHLFGKALKNSFEEIVNNDVYCNAELLSTFCDRILKSGRERLSETEVKQALDQIVKLFSYLMDKDLFAEIFRNQLAKRLLNQRSASDDAEKVMIEKLKLQCGTEFTSKMEGMLNDLAVEHEQKSEFDHRMVQQDTKLSFRAQVLTTGNWPSYEAPDVALPPHMSKCMEVFKEWHVAKHQNRRLTWVHSLGNATVRATYGKKAYDLQVTTLQAVVLNAFNDGKAYVFTELKEKLNLEEITLKPIIHSLSCGKHKVILKSPISNTIQFTDSFSPNANFSSNISKIRIPVASVKSSHNKKCIEVDRSVAIEAGIVRIMKARKTLSHQELVAEVLSQLTFFKLQPQVIKRRIEALILREYLERSPENSQQYNYLA